MFLVNHFEAAQSRGVKKCLLGEMPPPERDAFEEHFIDCPECAAALRVTFWQRRSRNQVCF
ncbi:zf-HC2 domain-containing protein [Tunturiibacter psychrotolerans]|uniref:zf-HC2 domain-containing protein n=1 Tax=Tunturiibacter psychrotolerans TaxID=3069686 RepID=UPI0033406EB2